MAADDFRSFGKALIRKLIAEVAEPSAWPRVADSAPPDFVRPEETLSPAPRLRHALGDAPIDQILETEIARYRCGELGRPTCRDVNISSSPIDPSNHWPNPEGQSNKRDERSTQHFAVAFESTQVHALQSGGRVDAQKHVGRDRADGEHDGHHHDEADAVLAGCKKARMPSTMGEEPRISSKAVRTVVLWRCS